MPEPMSTPSSPTPLEIFAAARKELLGLGLEIALKAPKPADADAVGLMLESLFPDDSNARASWSPEIEKALARALPAITQQIHREVAERLLNPHFLERLRMAVWDNAHGPAESQIDGLSSWIKDGLGVVEEDRELAALDSASPYEGEAGILIDGLDYEPERGDELRAVKSGFDGPDAGTVVKVVAIFKSGKHWTSINVRDSGANAWSLTPQKFIGRFELLPQPPSQEGEPDRRAQQVFRHRYKHSGMPTWADATPEVKALCRKEAEGAKRSEPGTEVWTIYSPTGDGSAGYVAVHGDYVADHPGAILVSPQPQEQDRLAEVERQRDKAISERDGYVLGKLRERERAEKAERRLAEIPERFWEHPAIKSHTARKETWEAVDAALIDLCTKAKEATTDAR